MEDIKFILNIGLNTADGALTPRLAREVLLAYGFLIVRDAVLESDTEPTLVAEVTTWAARPIILPQLFRRVAEALDQDCIAVYRERTRGGALIGPRADAWGPFNPEYFLLLDGRRLSEVVNAK